MRKDEAGHYYLRSAQFDSSSDAAVREQATEMIGYMNGAVKLRVVGSYHAVEVVYVACVDEGADVVRSSYLPPTQLE